ncbi:hypothetical protein SS50377_27793 [Spironucleus salmonicida]|uniref:Uncharacterized protein n=1 Tax=Spironucleus salmonicida TaxID=348837 RepID=A0A9P8LKJ1_9EUKA|nr:hypothetical protein SS50377_27793 [Spironucleus salmonicida]
MTPDHTRSYQQLQNYTKYQSILGITQGAGLTKDQISILIELLKSLLILSPTFIKEQFVIKIQEDFQACCRISLNLNVAICLQRIEKTSETDLIKFQKVKIIALVNNMVAYINEFISARKPSMLREVKDAINNVEAQEILCQEADEAWKDQKLSSLFDLMKVLLNLYPEFATEKLQQDLQVVERQVCKHNEIILDFSRMLSNIDATYLVPIRSLQKETVKVISSVVIYINEFIAARKESLPKEVKDAINNVEAQEILCQNADEAWKDQKLSSLFDLMKVLLNLYPEFATEKLQQDLQVVERQVCKHNEIILDFSRMLSNIDATYLVPIRSLQKETVKVISSVVIYINEFIAARKESLPKEVKDAINNVEAQEILLNVQKNQLFKYSNIFSKLIALFAKYYLIIISFLFVRQKLKVKQQNFQGNKLGNFTYWKDQKLSSLFDLMKVLQKFYPDFIDEKLKTDLQIIFRDIHNKVYNVDVITYLNNIGTFHANDLIKFQTKETIEVISSVVTYINEFIAARKPSMLREVKDAINNVEAQEILCQNADEAWKDQKLSSLFDLMKVLLNLYPEFATEKLQQDLQVVERQVCKHNEIILDFSRMLSNIDATYLVPIRSLQKETVKVINIVVVYINEFIAARKESLPKEVKDAINNVEAQEILCQNADEAWKDQKLSSLFDLMKVLLNLYPEFATEKLQQDLQVVERQVCKHNEIILDFSRMLSNIGATYLVPIRSLQKETVKVISSVVIYINEFIAARKESLPKEVKDAINNVEAQEILLNVQKNQLFKYSNIFSKLIALFAKYYLIIISFLFVRQKLKVKQQNFQGNKLGNFTYWKDQKLSSLFDLMKVLQKFYPDFIDEKLKTDLQIIFRDIHNKVYNVDVITYLNNIGTFHANDLIKFQTKETIEVISSVVTYINEFIAARKPSMLREVKDAINNVEAQEILCQAADEAWKDQKLSSLFDLMKVLLNLYPEFATEKLQQDLQVVERQVCKHNEIILDFSRMLSNIDATYLVPIRSLQKETVKVISSVVIYINEFIAARKESLPKEVKDAINNVEAQEILCQNADEAWKDQKLSSLFDLMKVLLNLYPEFATEKLQQDLQVVERQVCKHNEIILDFSRMLSNIDATYLVPIRSLQKETVKVINIVVVYINEFIAARKGTLPKEGTDAINSIEAQEILCQEADEAWKDQKLSTLCQLLLQMNRVSDQFATYASNLVQHLPQKYKQQDNSPQKVQINDNLLLLVDEVLVQQNRRRSYNQDLVFEKYTQCAKLYKPIEYLTLIMMNSPIIDNPRGLDQVQKYYNTITQGSSNSNGLLVFIQELYNLRAIESTFWRSINYYIERVQSHIKSYNIKTQCIYAGTDMSIFNFIKRNNIQQNIESSSDVRSYQHSRIIGIPQPHVSLLKQIFKSQQVTIALDNDKGLINKVQVMAAVTFLDYYNIQCPEKALEKQLYLPFISPQLWLCMKNQKIAFNNLKQVNVNNQTLFSVNKSNCFGQYFDIVKLDKNIQYNINFVQYDEFKILTTSSGYINLNYLVLFYYKIQINFSKFIKNISSDDINQLLVMQNLPYLTEINSLLLFLYTIVGNHETISDLSKIFKAQNLYSIYFNIVGSDLPQAASLELMKSICKNADFVCLQQPFDDFIYDDITFSEFQQSILKYGLNYSNLVFQSLKTTASCKTLICAISIDKQELFRKFQTIDQKHPDFLITFHGFTGLEGIMDQQDGVYYMMFDSGSHSEIGLTLKAKNFSKSIAQVGVIQSDIILFQSDVVTPKSMLRIYESEVRKSAKKRQK